MQNNAAAPAARRPLGALPLAHRVVGAEVTLDHPTRGRRTVKIVRIHDRIQARVVDVVDGHVSPFVTFDKLYV